MSDKSNRARIFRKVLEFINSGDWEEGDGFLIFGSDAYDRHLGIEPANGEDSSDFDEFLRALASQIKKVGGANSIAKRISLSPSEYDLIDVDLTSFFNSLGAERKARLARIISSVANEMVRYPKPETASLRDTSDEIDATLAAEAIDQLESSYRRLLTLDEMSKPATPFDGSEYFEEAHRCDLAGRKIAAAVLCRALLEAALSNSTDRSGWLKSQTTTHQRSYIGAMLTQAKCLGLIDGSRVAHGIEVKDAGDAAIHDLLEFRHKFSGRMPEIIDHTRMILDDLFNTTQKTP